MEIGLPTKQLSTIIVFIFMVVMLMDWIAKTPLVQNELQGSPNIENKENEPAIDGECISNNGCVDDIPQSEANTILSKAEDMNGELITFVCVCFMNATYPKLISLKSWNS